MHQRPLRLLLIADDKPGHYQQSEGVAAALARLRPVETRRLPVVRRFWLPTRTLAQLINAGTPPQLVLKLGYGLAVNDLPAADLIVSAGGQTLAANAAAARLLGVPNVFIGTLRRLAPEHMRIIVVPQVRLAASHPHYLLALPPSPFEIALRDRAPTSADAPPRRLGLLIGGDSGSVRYTARDWERLLAFLRESHRVYGMRWLVTTSRRTSPAVADALGALAAERNGPIERFVDYRVAGPGTLESILAVAEAIVVTVDSTAMITQSVCACLPVVSVASEARRMEARELEYRAYLAERGWLSALPLSKLEPETFLDALLQVTPRKTGALDDLAGALAQRLPELLTPAAGRSKR